MSPRPPSIMGSLMVTLCAILAFQATFVDSVAVMSIDLGAEWMKVAVVTPGVPMEIALNKESKRKTAVAVSIRPDERTFGSDALAAGIKKPKSCYFYLLDLMGKPFDHPAVKKFQERFPYFDMKPHPERGTVMFQHDENTTYSVEELMAMILQHARQIGEDYTQQRIKDTTITIPAYFNQAERRALMLSADIAGINVLQLISEPAAVALNYGMFRRKEINETPLNLMFYDMGAQDTTVSIVSFQTVKMKEKGFTETHPQAQILGLGYDRHLGGLDIQIRIRDYLAEKFNALGKTKTDVRTVPKAMAKLFKEAGRVKNILSANTNVFAQVENVMEDVDFRMELTRDELMEMNKDWLERVLNPVKMAIESSGMTMEEVSDVILVGAGTRVPRVQEILAEFFGKEPGKSLNTDESSAMGAVYRAADLSTGFKVKKFLTKEGVLFPIDVDFQRTLENGEKKNVKRSLFPRMNPFPQKKIMTFNKHVDDFTFYVNLNDLEHIPDDEITFIGSMNLTEVDVKGVAAALAKYTDKPNVESKGVKAHFNLDDSGLLSVTGVESSFERTISVEEQEEEERKAQEAEEKTEGKEDAEKKDDGGWGNLGDTISSFFNKENTDSEDNEKSKEDEKQNNEKDSEKKKKEEKNKDEKKKEEKKEKKEKKPKIETIKEPLEYEVRVVDMPSTPQQFIDDAKTSLKALNDLDETRKRKAGALNNLESFVIETRERLYQEIYEDSLTEEEKEQVQAKCSEISDWIDEEVTPETEVDILETKLKELKDLTSSWFARVREHIDRPEALGALNSMLNTTFHFLKKAKNKTGDDGLFTVVEVETLEKKRNEIEAWKIEMETAQAELPKYKMPVMTTSLIAEKGIELDREMKYLINKAKIAQAEKEKEKRKKEAEEKKAKEEAEKEKKKAKKKKKDENVTEDETAQEPTNEEEASTEVPQKESEETGEQTAETIENPVDAPEETVKDGNRNEESEGAEDVSEEIEEEKSQENADTESHTEL